MKVGDEVTALNENDGRYYPAHINDIKNVEFHKVAFEDSTFSNNLFQEDIIVDLFYVFYLASDLYLLLES